jgi:N utilization substance protein B
MFRVKYCREVILKLLYSADIQNEKISAPLEAIEKNLTFFDSLTSEEKDFIAKILNKVFQDQEEIDQSIKKHLIGWKLHRLTCIDRTLLRMGIAEMDFNMEKAIVIDDIIRIAKKYSEKDAFKIINAILDKI